MMARSAAFRYEEKHKRKPSDEQLQQLKTELVRAMVIQRDVLGAQKLEIQP